MADRNGQNRIQEILSDRQYRRSMIMSATFFADPSVHMQKNCPRPGTKEKSRPQAAARQ
jgi:hypothetical protein